jgi:hypothetical protein
LQCVLSVFGRNFFSLSFVCFSLLNEMTCSSSTLLEKKVLLELIEPVLTITLSSVVDVLAHDLVFYKLFCSLLQVIGWSMWFAEYLFLERSWAKDEKTLKVILHLSCTRHPTFSFSHIELFIFGIQWGLQRLKDFPRPFWLALFVEGTRFTPAKLLAAQEYAASQGLPAPRNVLIPRTKVLRCSLTDMILSLTLQMFSIFSYDKHLFY